nr:MAG TPA_asm: hypothetical protein [Caudoviricetes sp.]
MSFTKIFFTKFSCFCKSYNIYKICLLLPFFCKPSIYC